MLPPPQALHNGKCATVDTACPESVFKSGKSGSNQDDDFIIRWIVTGGRVDPLTPGKVRGQYCKQTVKPDVVGPTAAIVLEPEGGFLNEATGTRPARSACTSRTSRPQA